MKAKVLIGMLCIGLLGFTACDKEEIAPSQEAAGISSSNDNNGTADPKSEEEVSLVDNSGVLDGGKVLDGRVDVNGKYVISYFENGTPTGGVDVTSQYQGYVLTVDDGKLTVSGNGLDLVGSINIDEDRRVVEILLPQNDRLNDIDPMWSLNELTSEIIGMASPFMDAPRDAMILTKVP